jgi:hypothetical protein
MKMFVIKAIVTDGIRHAVPRVVTDQNGNPVTRKRLEDAESFAEGMTRAAQAAGIDSRYVAQDLTGLDHKTQWLAYMADKYGHGGI